MDRALLFSLIALGITLFDLWLYWRWVFRKEIIPHPFTMFIWLVVIFIGASELVHRSEILASVAILIQVVSIFFAFAVWLVQIRSIHINWADYFFLFSGIFLIFYWRIESEYKHVLLVMFAIDMCAYSVSFKKAWIAPFTEKSLPYFVSIGTYVFTILSIQMWTFENLAMWIWTAVVNFTFACFVLGRQFYIKKHPR